jgi:hypothetical protein
MKKVRFLGLDVHAETITVAIAESEGEVRSLGTIPNREETIPKLVKKLGDRQSCCGLVRKRVPRAMFSTGS